MKFIVEMSKTRKVYENLYVGQNHRENFRCHSHSHPRHYPLRYPWSPHPVGLQSIRTCFFLPAFEKPRPLLPTFWTLFKLFQNAFEKRSNAFWKAFKRSFKAGSLWWCNFLACQNQFIPTSCFNSRLLTLSNYQGSPSLYFPVQSYGGSNSPFSPFLETKPALWSYATFYPCWQKYFQNRRSVAQCYLY